MDHHCTLVEVLAMLDLVLKSVTKQSKKISDGCTFGFDVDVIGLELRTASRVEGLKLKIKITM